MTGTNLSNTAQPHRLRILLQWSNFLRDSAEYIRRHASNDVRGTIDNQKLLKQALLHSPQRTGAERCEGNTAQCTRDFY